MQHIRTLLLSTALLFTTSHDLCSSKYFHLNQDSHTHTGIIISKVAIAKYEWRYKIMNGKVYKRLYNASTDEWVGDWVLA